MNDMFGVRPTVRLRARGGSVRHIGEQGPRALAVPRAHAAHHVEPRACHFPDPVPAFLDVDADIGRVGKGAQKRDRVVRSS